MSTWVSLVNWTDEGIRKFPDTAERFGNFKALVERHGGKVRDFLYTAGKYDMVAVTEFPDDESGVAVLLQVGALGFVRTVTMRAFTAEEMAGIISRTR